MRSAAVSRELITRFPEITKMAEDLQSIGQRFSALRAVPIPKGAQSVDGLAWRCQAFAAANLLRGEELLKFGILALNEGAIITAQTLARSLDETLAAVVFARTRIERAVATQDVVKLTELLERLFIGSKYQKSKNTKYPEPYNVMKMVDETGKYLESFQLPGGSPIKRVFRDNYDLASEFVHPSLGSFTVYQQPNAETRVFDRAFGSDATTVSFLLSSLRMPSHLLLSEAEVLSSAQDLPVGWPGQPPEANTEDL